MDALLDHSDHWDDSMSDSDQSDYSDASMGTHRSEASSRTSADMSVRSASPARSVVSVTASLRAQAIRVEHGRGVNNYSDVYLLPADDDEVNRLSEYLALILCF